MIKIPFTITTYETALINVLSYMNEKHQGFKIEKKIQQTGTKITASGRIHINEKQSEYFTITEQDQIENIATAKAIIKLIYFCATSMGIQLDWSFDKTDQKPIREEYKPKLTWEKDLAENGIHLSDIVVKKDYLEDIKTYIKEKTANKYPIDDLIREIKKKRNVVRVSGATFLKYVYGSTQYKAAVKLYATTRPAKKIKPKQADNTPQEETQRDVIKIMKLANEAGITKTSYPKIAPQETLKKWASLSMFAANAPLSEIQKLINTQAEND